VDSCVISSCVLIIGNCWCAVPERGDPLARGRDIPETPRSSREGLTGKPSRPRHVDLSVVASTIDLLLLAWPAAHHIASNGATWGQTGPMRGGGYAASYDGTGHDSHCQHGRGSMRYVSSRGEEGWVKLLAPGRARETQARQQTVSSYCE
jgi:hypothetical protein